MKRSLRSWLWRVPIEQEVDEEIAFHLEMRTRELIARGTDPKTAREMALARAGDLTQLRRSCIELGRKRDREMRLTQWLDEFRDDVKLAVRQLRARKLFTAVATLTLALGIGANAVVFSVVKSVLLDALPYEDADRLVRVYGRYRTIPRGPLSAATIADIAGRQQSFESLAAFQDLATDAVYTDGDAPLTVKIGWVEPGLFHTLGIVPAHGRGFAQDEGTSALALVGGRELGSDTAPIVMVSYAAWQRLLSGDPWVLGREVRIDGVPRTVIGVLPRDFVGPMGFVGPVGEVDFYFALDLAPVAAHAVLGRRSYTFGLVGRLRPDVSDERAERELAAIGDDLAREYPDSAATLGLWTTSIRDAMGGDTRTPLLVLMSSAGLVLLIACANLAGALLSRAIGRRREFSVRVALGAGRGRLVRQLLTESTLLALAGGAAGLLLAGFLLGLLRGLALPALPAYADLSLDGGAMLVTALLALATGLAFGVAPALAVGRSDAQSALREETRASESRRSRGLRGVLVASQIALCLSVLAGAGLLARSLWAMSTTSLGFDPDGVLTMNLRLPARDYPDPQAFSRFYERFLERLATIPGVETAASSTFVPTIVLNRMGFTIEGAPPPPDGGRYSFLYSGVSDDYFRLLRIPTLQGRTFGPEDRPSAPRAIVISASMARRHWPAGDPLGARLRVGPMLVEVVGVVGDVRNDPARADAEPMAYMSVRQNPWPMASFLLRTKGDPLALVRSAERELAALDPGLPLDRPTTLRTIVGGRLMGRRLPTLLMSAFGVLALLVASVGVYAMFSNMATTREREFGVRMALGSRPRAIAGLVLQQGAWWMAAGLAGGALGVAVVARLVRELLYEVRPFDPITLGAAVGLLVLCATLALLIPVRRATQVDPVIALRAQ